MWKITCGVQDYEKREQNYFYVRRLEHEMARGFGLRVKLSPDDEEGIRRVGGLVKRGGL
ncbi:MAG: hypothetical protein ACUVQ5_05740, partial [Candidatus Methanomethylicaceae archaeon]